MTKEKNELLKNPYADITANKHGGNKQSQDANIKVAEYKMPWREKVLAFMAQRDAQGLGTSCRHACDHFGKEGQQLSPRFTELKADGLIEPTRVVENDYMVFRLTGSKNVGKKPPPRRCLVIGPNLVGEITLDKGPGGWQIATITPNLKSIIGDTPVPEIGRLLDKLPGFKRSWVETKPDD